MLTFIVALAVIYALAALAAWDTRRIQRKAQGPTGGLFPLFDEHHREQAHDDVEDVA